MRVKSKPNGSGGKETRGSRRKSPGRKGLRESAEAVETAKGASSPTADQTRGEGGGKKDPKGRRKRERGRKRWGTRNDARQEAETSEGGRSVWKREVV